MQGVAEAQSNFFLKQPSKLRYGAGEVEESDFVDHQRHLLGDRAQPLVLQLLPALDLVQLDRNAQRFLRSQDVHRQPHSSLELLFQQERFHAESKWILNI